MTAQQYKHFNPSTYNLDVKIATVRTGSHCKFNINYHLIWIYRNYGGIKMPTLKISGLREHPFDVVVSEEIGELILKLVEKIIDFKEKERYFSVYIMENFEYDLMCETLCWERLIAQNKKDEQTIKLCDTISNYLEKLEEVKADGTTTDGIPSKTKVLGTKKSI